MSLCGDSVCENPADPNDAPMFAAGVGLVRKAPALVKAAPQVVKSVGEQIDDAYRGIMKALNPGEDASRLVSNTSQQAIARTTGSVKQVTKASTGEREFAEEFFASRGYNVELAGRGKAGADIRILDTGQRFELKQLTTSNPSKVATRIQEALKQAPNAIIDLRGSRLTDVQALMGYNEAVRKGFVHSEQTVRIITKQGLDMTF